MRSFIIYNSSSFFIKMFKSIIVRRTGDTARMRKTNAYGSSVLLYEYCALAMLRCIPTDKFMWHQTRFGATKIDKFKSLTPLKHHAIMANFIR